MENENNLEERFGKKAFFLYPSVVVQNQLIPELAQQEYEVYAIKETKIFPKVLEKYPNSLVFINIDEGMPEKEWDTYIRSLLGKGYDIGVISTTNNENIQRKYINIVKVPCGFIHIKSDINKSLSVIVNILNSKNAKGRRKFIRASAEEDATINIPFDGSYINGRIRDISVMGLSCFFSEDPKWEKNSYLENIQLKLQSQLLKAEGIVFGSRIEGPDKVYVLVFTQKVDPDTRSKIRKYIQSNLQAKMDTEFAR